MTDKNLNSRFKNTLTSKFDYSPNDSDRITYMLTVILSEISKLVIFIIFFTVLNLGHEFIVAFILTMILKVNIGGFHFKTYFSCISFSLIYFLGLIFINQLVIPPNILIGLGVFNIFILVLIAPVISTQRQDIKTIKKSQLKMFGLAISTLYVFFFIIKNNTYTSIAVWIVIILTSLLLIHEILVNFKKKSRNI